MQAIKPVRVALLLCCAILAALAISPVLAAAKPAADDEYGLAKLPDAGSDRSGRPPAAISASTDGSEPTLPLIAAGGIAAVAVGAGAWRLRKRRET